MATICDYLIHDHQQCDEFLYLAETEVGNRNWEAADIGFRRFHHALERHLILEEAVLFPAFKEIAGKAASPVSMLLAEHLQIRGIAQRMENAIERRDTLEFWIHSETLFVLMQHHSVKEEEMLYPFLDRILAGRRDQVIEAMCRIGDSGVEVTAV